MSENSKGNIGLINAEMPECVDKAITNLTDLLLLNFQWGRGNAKTFIIKFCQKVQGFAKKYTSISEILSSKLMIEYRGSLL